MLKRVVGKVGTQKLQRGAQDCGIGAALRDDEESGGWIEGADKVLR